jgi:type IV pilus assembly protein PilV
MTFSPAHIGRFSGFTLLELLIAMIIMAIGLLGLAALQLLSIRDNQDVYWHSQTVALSYEMADRIHANAGVWSANTLPAPANSCSDNCNSADHACNATTMAAYDYCVWNRKVKTQLGNEASATVSISPVAGSDVCLGDETMRCLTLTWVNARQQTAKFDLELRP